MCSYLFTCLTFIALLHSVYILFCTQAVKSLEKEIKLLQNMKHDRIVQYYATERTETSIRIFMEYMSGVSSGDG